MLEIEVVKSYIRYKCDELFGIEDTEKYDREENINNENSTHYWKILIKLCTSDVYENISHEQYVILDRVVGEIE